MATRILNLSVGEGETPQYCPWCDDTGFLYLHRWIQRKSQRGEKYEEQVMAPCGFCQRGHEWHRKHGGVWEYALEEVDVSLTDDAAQNLDAEGREVYAKIQAAGDAIRARSREMQLPTPPRVRLDGAFYASLGPGPGPAKVGEHSEGQTLTPDTDETRN